MAYFSQKNVLICVYLNYEPFGKLTTWLSVNVTVVVLCEKCFGDGDIPLSREKHMALLMKPYGYRDEPPMILPWKHGIFTIKTPCFFVETVLFSSWKHSDRMLYLTFEIFL